MSVRTESLQDLGVFYGAGEGQEVFDFPELKDLPVETDTLRREILDEAYLRAEKGEITDAEYLEIANHVAPMDFEIRISPEELTDQLAFDAA